MKKPTPFGPYLLLERIAVGGMAEIFLARKDGLNGFFRHFVIKRLHPQYSVDRQFVDMLIDEAKVTAQLTHPNIIQIYDLGELDGHFYLALEYVHGHDLFEVLKTLQSGGHQMPVPAAIFVTQELLAGLHYAHFARDERGEPLNIIHRDISPQNLLLSYEGEVKVIDFGIVKAEKRLTETASGVIKGKFYYMSPEQASAKTIDHRSDVFSAGIVLYEALVAAPLYDDEEDSSKLLKRVQEADIAPPSTLRGGIPHAVEEVLMRALHRDPDARFQTAIDFHRALSDAIAHEPLQFNRIDLALYLRKLIPAGRDRRMEEVEELHLKERSVIQKVSPASPRPGVSASSGIVRSSAQPGRRSQTQVSSIQPIRRGHEESDTLREAIRERDENLKLALAAVVMAILLVSAAIIYVVRTTPPVDGSGPVNATSSHPVQGETNGSTTP